MMDGVDSSLPDSITPHIWKEEGFLSHSSLLPLMLLPRSPLNDAITPGGQGYSMGPTPVLGKMPGRSPVSPTRRTPAPHPEGSSQSGRRRWHTSPARAAGYEYSRSWKYENAMLSPKQAAPIQCSVLSWRCSDSATILTSRCLPGFHCSLPVTWPGSDAAWTPAPPRFAQPTLRPRPWPAPLTGLCP